MRRTAIKWAVFAACAALAGGCGQLKNLNPLLSSGGVSDSSRFGYEDGTVMGWAAIQPGSATSAFNTGQVSYFGAHSLGVQAVNMDSGPNPLQANHVFAPSARPDLSGRTLSVWVYAPAEVAPGDDTPSQAYLFIKDQSYNYANNPGANLARKGWTKLSFAPQANPLGVPVSTGNYYYAANFNPSVITEIGVKVIASGASGAAGFKFTGNIFIDGVDW